MTADNKALEQLQLTTAKLTQCIDAYINDRSVRIEALRAMPAGTLVQLLNGLEPSEAAELFFRPITALYKGKDNPPDHGQFRQTALAVLCRLLLDAGNEGKALLRNLLTCETESTNKPALHLAAQVDYGAPLIEYLLKVANLVGINDYVNIRDNPEIGVGYGRTALSAAVSCLHLSNIAMLLENRANPNLRSQNGNISLEDILLEKAGSEDAAAAIKLLLDYRGVPLAKTKYAPYLQQLSITPTVNKYESVKLPKQDVKSQQPSHEQSLLAIIYTFQLFEFAIKRKHNLAAFVEFVNTLMERFSAAHYAKVQDLFLKTLDTQAPLFIHSATTGPLDINNETTQKQVLEAAMHLMDKNKRPVYAFVIYNRLLTDADSELRKKSGDVYKILRWLAFCIGKIYQQKQQAQVVNFSRESNIKRVQAQFLDVVGAVEYHNLSELVETLHTLSQCTELPYSVRQETAKLLKQHGALLGMHLSASKEKIENKESKAITTTTSNAMPQSVSAEGREQSSASSIVSTVTGVAASFYHNPQREFKNVDAIAATPVGDIDTINQNIDLNSSSAMAQSDAPKEAIESLGDITQINIST